MQEVRSVKLQRGPPSLEGKIELDFQRQQPPPEDPDLASSVTRDQRSAVREGLRMTKMQHAAAYGREDVGLGCPRVWGEQSHHPAGPLSREAEH